MTNKKNMILMIPQLNQGGAERAVSRLSFLLSDTYNLKIIVFNKSNENYEVGCEIVELSTKNRLLSSISFLEIIIRLFKFYKFKSRHHIDITYSFGDKANIVNVLTGGKDKKVISVRGYKRIRQGENLIEKLLLKPVSKYICKKSDRIISVSNLITETLIKVYNLNSKKIHTVFNGYDTDMISKQAEEELDKVEEKIFENDVIITAGTFKQEKGYWHLLKAFSLVHANKPDLKLVILGADYQNNLLKVKKLAEELGIDESVHFLGYQKNPYKYFVRSKLYVLSSVFEGFPNALVEAMCCNIPIVASDCPSGPREILAPKLDSKYTIDSFEQCEYGVLVKRLNPKENYNYQDIEFEDVFLADAIETSLIQSVNSKYSIASKKRSLDFSYNHWIKAQEKALEFS